MFHILCVVSILGVYGVPSELYIGGLFTMFQGPSFNYSLLTVGNELLASMIFALKEINNKTDGIMDDLLPNTKLKLVFRDDKFDGVVSMRVAIDVLSNSICVSNNDCKGVLAMIGPMTSTATLNVQYVASQLNTPQISGTAVSAQLRSLSLYPTFLRTIPSDYGQTAATASLINKFRWTCASTIGAAADYSTSGIGSFIREAQQKGVSIVTSATILAQDTTFNTYIQALKNGRCNLIVAWALMDDLVKILSAAYQENFYGDGVQWVLSPTAMAGMIDKLSTVIGKENAAKVLKGSLSLQVSYGEGTPYYAEVLSRWVQQDSTQGINGTCKNATDDDIYRPTYLYQGDHDGDPSTPMKCAGSTFRSNNFVNWAVYVYDATFVIANALHNLVYNQGKEPCSTNKYQSKIANTNSSCFNGGELLNTLLQTSYQGVSGNISFGPNNGDRATESSRYFMYSHSGTLDSTDIVTPYRWVGVIYEPSLIPCDNYKLASLACNPMIWPNGAVGLTNAPSFSLPKPQTTSTTSNSAFSTAWIIIVIVLGIFLVAGVILVIGYIIWKANSKRRILRMVPKGKNMAILFTDIQNSSLLWSNYADEMKVAMGVHNMILRQAIKSYNGYEVKTIGDSFMVTFHSCKDAIGFCRQIQQQLLEAVWPPEIMKNENCEEVRDGKGTLLWYGLRVRVGMHAGPADVEYDPRTGKVDYFGQNINLAARVEGAAAGGQTLITSTCYDVLGEEEETRFQYKGEFTFKGVTGKRAVYEYIVIPGRQFAEKVHASNDADGSAATAAICNKCMRPCPTCMATVAKEGKSKGLRRAMSRAISQYSGGSSRSRYANSLNDSRYRS